MYIPAHPKQGSNLGNNQVRVIGHGFMVGVPRSAHSQRVKIHTENVYDPDAMSAAEKREWM